MNWFRSLEPALELDSSPLMKQVPTSLVPPIDLPTKDGIITGCLTRQAKNRDGVIQCKHTAEGGPCEVYIHRTLLNVCEAVPGDTLAFCTRRSQSGQLQAVGPLWKQVGPKSAEELFPEHIGILRTIAASGESGFVDSRFSRELYGRDLFIAKAFLTGGMAAGNVLAFNSRENSKGNPQAAAPIFKMMLKDSRPQLLQPQRREKVKHIPCDLCADWASFPADVLPRTLASSGPVELCRLVSVCQTWRLALKAAECEVEGFWRALCFEKFPVMAAKILRERSGEPGIESDILEQADDQVIDAAIHAVCCWKEKFVHRYVKQLAWDKDRTDQQQLRQRRLDQHIKQVTLEDKQRGQSIRGQALQNDSKTQRTLKAIRQKTCRRCGMLFLPGNNPPDSCRWHMGQYSAMNQDGRSEAGPGQRLTDQRLQQVIRSNARKKKSRQHNMVIPGGVMGRTDGSAENWAWSCCSSPSIVAPGCAFGPHT